MKAKAQFEIIIGYKAVVSVYINAENEDEAKKQASEIFEKSKNKKFYNKYITLQDDNTVIAGAVNMDKAWNSLNN